MKGSFVRVPQDLMKQKVIFPLLKLAVVSAALFWLSRRVDFAGVWRVIRDAHRGALAVAALLSMLPVLISGFRWRTLLGTLGIDLSAARLALICQIGQFFGVLVPGVAGDDGTRLLYISRLAPGRASRACVTVLLDRFIGFCCLFVLALVCIPMHWALLGAQSTSKWVASGFFAAGLGVLSCCALLFCLTEAQLRNLIAKVQRRFPNSKILNEWAAAADVFSQNKPALLRVAALALCGQLFVCCSYWAVGSALGIEAPLTFWVSVVPVILLSGVLPITFAGIGVRDYFLFLFLGSFSTGTGDRLAAVSLLLLGYTLLLALLGGVAYLFYRVKPKEAASNPPEMAAETTS
jgi:uncharacterized protein (TIRG00374 family)